MTSNSVPTDLYPSASQDGQAIPLAAVRPIGCYAGTLAALQDEAFSLPEEINLISFMATKKGFLKLSTAAQVENYRIDMFAFVPNVMYELVVTKDIFVQLLEEGDVIINVLMKWGQLRNIGSYSAS